MRIAYCALAGACAAVLMPAPASACAGDDSQLLGTVCAVAWMRGDAFNNAYVLADGRQLKMSDYPELFSVIGNTFGGDGRTTFAVPNLSGSFALHPGQLPVLNQNVAVGQTGGAAWARMTLNQLPAHTHGVTNATAQASVSAVRATGALAGLTASADLSAASAAAVPLSGIAYSVTTNNLALNAATSGPLGTAPGGNALGPTGFVQIYSATAPSIAMAAGSIGGTSSLSTTNPVLTSNAAAPATVVAPGTASTAVSPAYLPTLNAAGATGTTGASVAIPIMPPFVAMWHYIAYRGIYPSRQ